ncbi:MAG: FAD-binding protein, partial [Anaerolineaceae bacterium]
MSEMKDPMTSRQPQLPSADTLLAIFGDRLQRYVRMSRFSSARVGGPVDFLAISQNADELEQDISSLWRMNIPFTLLGGASNVLVSEKGMHGLVLINHARHILVQDQSPSPFIRAESGALMTLVAQRAGKAGLSGLEWASGLPGTLGGAVYGNAGAFGSEISQNLIVANILHCTLGRTQWSSREFEYQYRSSILKRQHCSHEVVILSADLKV